jgi:5-hydroxyisourate hydrolase-like protein (transthyretin family)
MGKAMPRALFIPVVCLVAALFLCASSAFAQSSSRADNTGQSAGAAADAPVEKSIISGKVVYEGNGRPVRRANVMLMSAGNQQAAEKYTTATDSQGKFRIRNIAAGTYFVMVDAPGIITPLAFISMEAERSPTPADWGEVRKNFEEVSVDGSNEVKVEVRARRGGAISGKVSYRDGDPAINVQIGILRKKGNSTARFLTGLNPSSLMAVRTDDRGMYRVSGLPPGEYVVNAAEMHTDIQEDAAYDPGHGMEKFMRDLFSSDALAVTYYGDVTSAREATVVKIEADEEAQDIDISLIQHQTYMLAGTLTAKRDRRPLAEATIKIRSTENIGPLMAAERAARTDEQGNWLFKDVPEGTYIISAEPPYERDAPATTADGKPATQVSRKLSRKEQQVTVDGSDVAGLGLELSEGASVSGTVIIEGALNNSTYAYVYAERPDGIKVPEREYTGVPPDGNFTLEGLTAGELFLSAAVAQAEYYPKSITAHGTDLLREPLKLAETQEIKDVRIVLSPDMAALKGRVVDATGSKPRADVLITLIPNIPQRWRAQSGRLHTRTDKAGEFNLRGAPGEYLVFLWPLGQMPDTIDEGYIKAHAAGQERITLQPGGRQNVDFVMPPGQN